MDANGNWISAEETATRWSISSRRVRILCTEGKILSCKKIGRQWLIDPLTPKPADRRSFRYSQLTPSEASCFEQIESMRRKLARATRKRPPSDDDRDKSFDAFFVEAASDLDNRYFSQAEIRKVASDEVVAGKSLSRHLKIRNLREALLFAVSQAGLHRRLEPKILRELNSLLVYGTPSETNVYRCPRQRAEKSLSGLLRTYRSDRGNAFKRIVRTTFDLIGSNPFLNRRVETAYVFSCYLLMAGGFPPGTIEKRFLLEDFRHFERSKNIEYPATRLRNMVLRGFARWPLLVPLERKNHPATRAATTAGTRIRLGTSALCRSTAPQ